MRSLVILSVLGLVPATSAFADDSFETLAQSAQRVKRVDDLVWALTAKCDAGNDTQQRQCRRLRDARATEVKGATLLIEADHDAFTVGAWSSTKKSSPLSVTACIRCKGIDVDGKSWFVAGTRETNQPPRFQAGKQVGATLEESTKTFADSASAKKFADSVATAKVQFVVRVPAAPVWTDSNKQGIAFEVLAYRVYSPCDGGVLMAKPKSGPGDVDKRACAGIPAAGQEVEQLTPAMIKEVITPTLEAAKSACVAKHGGKGSGKLKLQIAPDGRITESHIEGELADTDTARCIEAAIRNVGLPKSKKPKTNCVVPINLQ